MKTVAALLLILCTSVTFAQESGYKYFAETEHLRFAWDDTAVAGEGLEVLKQDGEKYYAAIKKMLGEVDNKKVTVLLEGPAERADGSWGYPRVDGFGRVHLYRFGPTWHDYQGAYAHEMVHAMRFWRMPHYDWFFEEGLAEFIALRIDDDLRGFPWYGFPVNLVAGQWLVASEGIPLATIKDNHGQINLPCKAQTYSLRSAFFDYLGRNYSDDAVLTMARQDQSGISEDYKKYLGSDFQSLAIEWRAQLLSSYAKIEYVDSLATVYRKEAPIRYMPVCDANGVVQR